MMNYLISMNKHLRIGILLSGFFLSFILFFSTGNSLFILTAFILFGLLIASNIKYDQNRIMNIEKSLDTALIKNKFKVDNSYLSDDYLSGIAINESESKLAILTRTNRNNEFRFKTFNFTDIIESSIDEDGVSIIKTSIGSQVGGALVGGIVAGGIGAIVGGLNGSKTSTNSVYKLTLNVAVNDLSNPVYEINFLNVPSPLDKHSELYRKVSHDINKWHKMVSVILKRNDLNSKSV